MPSAFLLGLKALGPVLEQLAVEELSSPEVEQAVATLVTRLLSKVTPAPPA